MGLLFCDSFDAYTKIADIKAKGWQGAAGSSTVSTDATLSLTSGAYGGGCLVITGNGTDSVYKPNLFTYADGYTLYVGMLHKQTGVPSAALSPATSNQGGLLLLGFDLNSASNSDSYPVLFVNTAGKIQFCQFGGALNATVGKTNLADGAYHWIEAEIILTGGATGSVLVYVDGVLDLSLTGIVTVPAASGVTPTGHVGVGTGALNGSTVVTDYYDDFIVWDNTGASFNSFPIGQKRIYVSTPNAAGTSTQFTPSAGANYAVAAQAYSATATLTATTAGLVDTYATNGLGGATPAEIDAVVVNTYAYNPANGTRKLSPILQSGGTNSPGAAVQLTTTLTTYQQPYYKDSSNAAWTASTLASIEVGVESV